MDLLNRLRSEANRLAEKKNEEKYNLIIKLLNEDDCFFRMSSDAALNILEDLGYDEKERLIIYRELISPESYKTIFKRVDVK